MTDLDIVMEAGGAAWVEGNFFQAHDWWEAAWQSTPQGPLREGLRALTQWAAASHLEALGRHVAAESVRESARLRFLRTENRLALAPFAVDLPSSNHDDLVPRDPNTAFPVTAVLIAAGHGRRAGGPKALIAVDGQPLWLLQVQRLRAIGLPQVIAVLHPDAVERCAVPSVTTVVGNPDGSPLHSLQRALGLTTGPILLMPVDGTVPSRGVVARLLATAITDPNGRAVRPSVATPQGPRGGHPLWLAASTCRALAAVDAQAHRLDTYLRTLGPGYVAVPVAEAAVLHNFNLDGVSR